MNESPSEREPTENNSVLREAGPRQELERSMGAFSSFAIAMATICVLSGGITSFPQGLCGVGGGAIGLGWPLCFLFTLAVALTMAQAASAFPTAGGAYHWSTILGGRAWGWATACFGITGLVTAIAAVNVGAGRFLLSAMGRELKYDPAQVSYLIPAAIAILMTAAQAFINHRGIKLTTRLTDFSGYLILVMVVFLTACMILFGVILPNNFDPARLIALNDFSGDKGGGVWPATNNLVWLFLLGLLLPAYTLTGFDASAQTAEETKNASNVVPRGIVRAVIVSGVAGWLVLVSIVLAIPSVPVAAAKGDQCFFYVVRTVLPYATHGVLYTGILVAQFLCGLATMTSVSRMLYAFARDGGPPGSRWLKKVNVETHTPAIAIWTIAVAAVLFALLPYFVVAAVCAIFLYLSYVLPTALGLFAHGRTWTRFGPWHVGFWYKPLALVCVLGCLLVIAIGVQPPNQIGIPVVGGLAVVLAAIWWGHKCRHFPGPPLSLLQLTHVTESTVSMTTPPSAP